MPTDDLGSGTTYMMEVSQMSKYLYRSERLNFTSGLLATEKECWHSCTSFNIGIDASYW